MSGFAGITRALRARNFRLFVAGQGFSLIGTWMQQVAMSWLVYRFARHLPKIREHVRPIYVKLGILQI